MTRCIAILTVILLGMQTGLAASAAAAPGGILLRKSVAEIVELVTRKGGAAGARELAELGGEQAVKELLEQTARHGGDAAVGRLTHYARLHGAQALKAIKDQPVQMLRVLDQMPAGQVKRAIDAINLNPAAMQRLISHHGVEALQVSMRHPGVGLDIAQTLGRDGIRTALRLETPHAIQLSRQATALSRVPASQRDQILDMIVKAPANVLAFLEKHPRVLYTAATLGALLAYREAIMGGDEIIIHEDGRVEVVSKPGLITRTAVEALDTRPVSWAVIIFAVLLGLGLMMALMIWQLKGLLIARWRLHRETLPPQP